LPDVFEFAASADLNDEVVVLLVFQKIPKGVSQAVAVKLILFVVDIVL
jgi:hypothetical protein